MRPPELEPISFEPYTIYRGDCLDILRHFPSECADLIYIDPPFNSNRNYEVFWGDTAEKRAFDDRYGDAMAYITYMRPRIAEHFRVLKKTGSFYYHCDWHASHYIKVMLDEIFGANYFQNEVVWKRTSAHNDPRKYGNIHDAIFYYVKSSKYTWNPQYAEYSKDYIAREFKTDANGSIVKYNDLTAPSHGRDAGRFEWRGVTPPPTRMWRYKLDKLEELYSAGLIKTKPDGTPIMRGLKTYLDESSGVPLQTMWTDILRVGNTAKERLGYPTQKPVALLERIIKASSNEGDIVLDGFCGCGTTLVASENLNRKWLGIDISPTACRVMGERIFESGRIELPITGAKKRGKNYFKFSNLPMSIPQLKALPPFEFENWAVLAVGQFFNMYAQPNRAKVGDLGIDGRLYLPSNIEKHASKDSEKTPLFRTVEGEKYIPIQVKQQEKVGRPDIDKFARAIERDGRTTGVFVAFGFSRESLIEISKLARAEHNARRIIPLTVERILASDFSTELDAWIGVEG
jgi:site-specific DNA-methyltransferase (adenine-specific)